MERSSSHDVVAQITAQAQAQSDENKQNNMLRLFRLAYFLFSREIPRTTTNWHALVSTVSASLLVGTFS